MSQHPSNYMENVPVKISERYKPPPKISLPQSVQQRLSADTIPCLNLSYDFSLEQNVMQRIDEWKRLRDNERDARRERMRKREQERQLRIEQEQKQLLTAVSYPSTEDLSSEDETVSEELEGAAVTSPRHDYQTENANVMRVPITASQHTRFDTILTPTVLPESVTYSPNSHCQQPAVVKTKINYSDFENDTSSPFDNVELKTINDLDILAQVLNITHLHSNLASNSPASITTTMTSTAATANQDNESTTTTAQSVEHNPENSPNTNHQVDIYSIANHENCNVATSLYNSVVVQPPPPTSMPNANHFYTAFSNSPTLHNHVNINGTVTQPADFYYYSPAHPHQNPTTTYNNYMYRNISYPLNFNQNPQNSVIGTTVNSVTTNSLAYRDYVGETMASASARYDDQVQLQQQATAATGEVAATVKSKSKSVPDIVKQLNAEIRDSEIRRARNNSQTVECFENKSSKTIRSKHLDEPEIDKTFMKLSPSSQTLVRNISSMGFPLELVSRIAERLGNDDKKIVEHLIPLSELLDLGFDESRISDALLRFDNNKEKALDFLIS